MGKKKRKSNYDDDDIFGGSLPANQQVEPHNADYDVNDYQSAVTETEASTAEGNVGDSASAPPPKKSEKGGSKNQKVVNSDLIQLEGMMIDILRKHRGRSDDWLYRTMEKNMRLPKNSLRQSVEPGILEDVMSRVQQTLDQEDEEEANKKRRWDALVDETSKKSELTEKDKAKLSAGARDLGLNPEEAVAMVAKTIENSANNQNVNGSAMVREGSHHEQVPDGNKTPLPVLILLNLHPHIEPSGNFLGKILQYICFLVYSMASIALGNQAKIQAKQLYESIHLPKIKAEQVTKETEEDERMLQSNTHLWSTPQQCWVEKDATHSHSSNNAPPTIRYNGTKWERWNKNLKTRTKAMKLAEAQGIAMPAFSKGTFVPVRAGEGWATAPTEPEVEPDQIVSAGIRFFACLPSSGEDGMALDVVDVTSWATKSMLSKEAASKLGVVDSGRDLFSFDVSSLQLRTNGKAKSSKKKKQKQTVGVDKEEENYFARKGVGITAKICKKYLDQMEKDMDSNSS